MCQTVFHDCEDTSQRKEYIVSVAIVRKLAQHVAIPFSTAAKEFRDYSEASPTLLLVRLHRHSRLFPDVYFDWYHQHFMIMHDSGVPFNVGHPRSSWVLCSIMHSRLGISLPLKRSCLQLFWTI